MSGVPLCKDCIWCSVNKWCNHPSVVTHPMPIEDFVRGGTTHPEPKARLCLAVRHLGPCEPSGMLFEKRPWWWTEEHEWLPLALFIGAGLFVVAMVVLFRWLRGII